MERVDDRRLKEDGEEETDAKGDQHLGGKEEQEGVGGEVDGGATGAGGHPNDPHVRQVDGVSGPGQGPKHFGGEEATEEAAISGHAQPHAGGHAQRPAEQVEWK